MCLVGFQKTNQNAPLSGGGWSPGFPWAAITSTRCTHRWSPLPSELLNASLPLRQLRVWVCFFPSHPSSTKHWIISFYSKSYCICFLHCRQSHIFGSRWRCRQKWKLCLSLHQYNLPNGGRGHPCVTVGTRAPEVNNLLKVLWRKQKWVFHPEPCTGNPVFFHNPIMKHVFMFTRRTCMGQLSCSTLAQVIMLS